MNRTKGAYMIIDGEQVPCTLSGVPLSEVEKGANPRRSYIDWSSVDKKQSFVECNTVPHRRYCKMRLSAHVYPIIMEIREQIEEHANDRFVNPVNYSMNLMRLVDAWKFCEILNFDDKDIQYVFEGVYDLVKERVMIEAEIND